MKSESSICPRHHCAAGATSTEPFCGLCLVEARYGLNLVPTEIITRVLPFQPLTNGLQHLAAGSNTVCPAAF